MAKATSYRRALADAKKELVSLFRQREELERKIARAKQGVIALARLCSGDEEHPPLTRGIVDVPQMGLTDAIRTALMASRRPLGAMAVRSALESVGYDIGTSPNTLVSIHTILKRLCANGEAQWVGKHSRAKNEKGLFADDGFWWGKDALPKGWGPYTPFTKFKQRSKKYDSAKAKERDFEAQALKVAD